jgi:hypothetical protein
MPVNGTRFRWNEDITEVHMSSQVLHPDGVTVLNG